MTNKTRIRVARVTAGAVIAFGASLTAAGAASAADSDACILGVLCDTESPSPEPTPSETVPTEIPTEEPPTEEPPTAEPPTAEPPTEQPPTEEPPTADPTEPAEPTADPTDGAGNGGSTGGDSTGGTTPDGGSNDNVAQEEGSSALTDTGDEAQASDAAAQGSGDELAETGAAETTFLLVGAATMIAGGIGFRFLPRLMNGRGAAA
ncbi:LPXTG cell wall anchor domain-containing protein [Streptomyces sp. b94]|uniref:LPXTG cell wall anchor domain-containing protein n=1 Tax=Streptomyces sp. b94 TaxID=1827634 RepID=UPI001B36E51D|nr:LPXTG cell wall anchor domain-containing protein [Streptomyces sp. b94]MBQ1097095.1 LPXTG cell wall anchor domain-containing protein [Streptomyces sp. b94]